VRRFCNRRDYEWRTRIDVMLGKRVSLGQIADKLNAEKVPTIHGTNSSGRLGERPLAWPR
jgi:hypothetical protein